MKKYKFEFGDLVVIEKIIVEPTDLETLIGRLQRNFVGETCKVVGIRHFPKRTPYLLMAHREPGSKKEPPG